MCIHTLHHECIHAGFSYHWKSKLSTEVQEWTPNYWTKTTLNQVNKFQCYTSKQVNMVMKRKIKPLCKNMHLFMPFSPIIPSLHHPFCPPPLSKFCATIPLDLCATHGTVCMYLLWTTMNIKYFELPLLGMKSVLFKSLMFSYSVDNLWPDTGSCTLDSLIWHWQWICALTQARDCTCL